VFDSLASMRGLAYSLNVLGRGAELKSSVASFSGQLRRLTRKGAVVNSAEIPSIAELTVVGEQV